MATAVSGDAGDKMDPDDIFPEIEPFMFSS